MIFLNTRGTIHETEIKHAKERLTSYKIVELYFGIEDLKIQKPSKFKRIIRISTNLRPKY